MIVCIDVQIRKGHHIPIECGNDRLLHALSLPFASHHLWDDSDICDSDGFVEAPMREYKLRSNSLSIDATTCVEDTCLVFLYYFSAYVTRVVFVFCDGYLPS